MPVYGLTYVRYKVSHDSVERDVLRVPSSLTDTISIEHGNVRIFSSTRQETHRRPHGWFACPLQNRDGLNHIIPLEKTELTRQMRTSSSFTTKLVAVATDKDFWNIGGDKAIRMHVKPRPQRFVPSTLTASPGSLNENDPLLRRLGDQMITKAHLGESEDPVALNDSWPHANANAPLPDKWEGSTEFDDGPAGQSLGKPEMRRCQTHRRTEKHQQRPQTHQSTFGLNEEALGPEIAR